ncbi:hypothetical protein [Actinomadura bangladeshensis]|jgi:hypothetical protein|nr:hypothetical protein [Actinomadura bangladeshensis]
MIRVRDPGDEAMEFIRKALHGHLVREPLTGAVGLEDEPSGSYVI